MICNIEQRPGELIISYVNKEGNISYMKLVIPPQHQFIYVYAKQKYRTIPGLLSWDKKPVTKVPSAFLNRYRIQEFFIDAGDKIVAPLFERNMPILSSCDIEVDVTDEGFAEAENANNKINTIAWSCFPNIYVFGLKSLSGEQCNKIEKKINDHIKSSGKEYRFIYKQYDNEANMLYDFLYNYARHAPLITGWHFWNYDWRYIYNRCKRINLDISWMSPTRQWYPHRIMDRNRRVEIMIPQHKFIVDYMEIYKKWDRVIDTKENMSLDFAAEVALGIKKVKYPGTFKDLYNDFVEHVFYNAIDSIIVELLDLKLKTMSIFFDLGNITRVEAMNAFSPIAMLESTLARYAYKKGFVFPKTKYERDRKPYEGAFVYKPTPDLYEWVAGFDYGSQYPSIMRQFSISIENFIKKDLNYIPEKNEIKCSSGSIFDASGESFLPRILTDYYNQRKEAQNIAKKAEKEVSELEKILKERKNNIKKVL